MYHLAIVLTIVLTVYGQVVLKWAIRGQGAMPPGGQERIFFVLKLLLNPWIVSGFTAAFLAALCWMVALSKFDLSYAYPFMSLAFVLTALVSAYFFQEPFPAAKIAGLLLIVAGIVVSSRG